MMKFDFEKFDGKINFGLWQIQVKDILIKYGLHKVLKGKLTPEGSEKSSRVSLANGSKDCDAGSLSFNFVEDEYIL